MDVTLNPTVSQSRDCCTIFDFWLFVQYQRCMMLRIVRRSLLLYSDYVKRLVAPPLQLVVVGISTV